MKGKNEDNNSEVRGERDCDLLKGLISRKGASPGDITKGENAKSLRLSTAKYRKKITFKIAVKSRHRTGQDEGRKKVKNPLEG